MDEDSVDQQNLIRQIIGLIGDNPNREGVIDTPRRVIKSYRELFAGYAQDPKEILGRCFEKGSYDELVILKDIEMYSTCEHHMIPFFGKCHIGYIPTDRVVGLSKLARLVECFARRLQIQERLTEEIANMIELVLSPKGTMVVIEAKHMCMCARGVGKQSSVMVTSSMKGAMRDDPKARSEFLSFIR